MSAFDKVIGYEDIKNDIIKVCDMLKNSERYERLGVAMPKGLMLHGDPGVGKTLIASCFIEESGYKEFILRKDKPDGEFIHEINEVFNKACENAPSVVFLDDFDKFAKEDSFESNDDEEYVAVQTCMDKIDDKKVFVIATVNRKYRIPDSLMRPGRFDKVIKIGKPSAESAKKIIIHYLQEKKISEGIDVEEIARIMADASCAELKSVIDEAGLNAGYQGKPVIDKQDIISACMRVLLNAPESKEDISEKQLRYVALHEAGHTVASEIIRPGSVSIVTLFNGRTTETKGITMYSKREVINFQEIEEEVIWTLAGRAAIEVEYGEIDAGASGDISKAKSIIKNALTDLCPLGWDTFCEDTIVDNWWWNNAQHKTSHEMEACYQEAKSILVENRSFLKMVADELMEKKTLTYKDVARIKESLKCA